MKRIVFDSNALIDLFRQETGNEFENLKTVAGFKVKFIPG